MKSILASILQRTLTKAGDNLCFTNNKMGKQWGGQAHTETEAIASDSCTHSFAYSSLLGTLHSVRVMDGEAGTAERDVHSSPAVFSMTYYSRLSSYCLPDSCQTWSVAIQYALDTQNPSPPFHTTPPAQNRAESLRTRWATASPGPLLSPPPHVFTQGSPPDSAFSGFYGGFLT